MGELALIAVRYCFRKSTASVLVLCECKAAWEEGCWRWKRVRIIATARMVAEFVLEGYRVWRVRSKDCMEMDYDDCLYWDELQGADHVP